MLSLTRNKRRLQGVRYIGEKIDTQDLRSMSAPSSVWIDCSFVNCDFKLADFAGSKFFGCSFNDCHCEITNFRQSEMRGVEFFNCDMEQSIFVSCVLEKVKFNLCRLALSSFYETTIRAGCSFESSNLHGADLRYIECAQDCSYPESVLWGVHVTMGCQFWNGKIDERSANLFAAILARVHPDESKRETLRAIASDEFAVVERLMGENV